MSARTASRSSSPVADRQAVIDEAAVSLATCFPAVPRERVVRVAVDVHDAIVATGVPVRAYLRNLVVHEARSHLVAEQRASDAAVQDGAPVPDLDAGSGTDAAGTGAAAAVGPTGAARQADVRPVLVGVDGSPAAGAALDRALVIAKALGVPLRVVSAWRFPMVSEPLPSSPTTPEEDVRRIIDDALRARFGDTAPAWISVATPQGAAAHVLIEESRSAQMLVVGSRGHGGVVGLLLGSVSAACAERAHCPVLVMHDPRRGRDPRGTAA